MISNSRKERWATFGLESYGKNIQQWWWAIIKPNTSFIIVQSITNREFQEDFKGFRA